jgi:hypothetical protein
MRARSSSPPGLAKAASEARPYLASITPSRRPVEVDGQTYEDLLWIYRTPLPESQKIAGLVSFYNEKVDLYVDVVLAGGHGDVQGLPARDVDTLHAATNPDHASVFVRSVALPVGTVREPEARIIDRDASERVLQTRDDLAIRKAPRRIAVQQQDRGASAVIDVMDSPHGALVEA